MTDQPTPRLKERYNQQVRSRLQQELGFPNPYQVPRLEKVVLNMGVGDALKDGRMLEAAVDDLTIITGQKPVITKARKSIAGFKLREGMPDRRQGHPPGRPDVGVPRPARVDRAPQDPGLPRAEPERVRRARQLHARA